MTPEMIKNRGLDAAEAEVVRIALHFRFAEANRLRISMSGKAIDDWPAWIAEREHLGHFVISLASRIVTSAAEASVGEFARTVTAADWARFDSIKERVAARDDEAYSRQFRREPGRVSLQKNRMHVAFEVIHGHEGLSQREREDFSVSEADEKRADEARTLRHADCIDVSKFDSGLRGGFADDWDDLTQMLARSQLRHHAAILAMDVHLRRDNARQDFYAVGDDCGGRLIAGGFDSENSRGHFTLRFALNAYVSIRRWTAFCSSSFAASTVINIREQTNWRSELSRL